MATKKKSAAPRPSKKDPSEEIAAHVLALLNNPHTPTELSEGIRDALCEMENMAQILARISEQPRYLRELIGRFQKGGAE